MNQFRLVGRKRRKQTIKNGLESQRQARRLIGRFGRSEIKWSSMRQMRCLDGHPLRRNVCRLDVIQARASFDYAALIEFQLNLFGVRWMRHRVDSILWKFHSGIQNTWTSLVWMWVAIESYTESHTENYIESHTKSLLSVSPRFSSSVSRAIHFVNRRPDANPRKWLALINFELSWSSKLFNCWPSIFGRLFPSEYCSPRFEKLWHGLV